IQRTGDRFERNEFEILVSSNAPIQIDPILGDKHSIWEGGSQRKIGHVDAICPADFVYRTVRNIEGASVVIIPLSTINDVGTVTLTGSDQVPLAIAFVINRQPLDRSEEHTS